MKPLLVTARLRAGYAASDPWSPALDGILAWVAMRERIGADEASLAIDDSRLEPVTGLPLAVVEGGGTWWYACSSPVPDGEAPQHRRYFHRRFDAAAASVYLDRGGKAPVKAGAYKMARLSVVVTATPAVTWHVIGDAAEIRRMLAGVTHIGRKPSQGYGRVDRWDVEPGGDPDRARHDRPIPETLARELGRDGTVIQWGLRPPARIAQNRAVCILPERET